MKRVSFLLFILFSLLTLSFAKSDDICGTWMEDDGDGSTYFYKCKNGRYAAKIDWVKVTTDSKGRPLLDKKNPVDSLKTHPIIGTIVMKDIEYLADEDKWQVNWCYDPRLGITAKGKMWIENGKLWLKASKFGFSKTKWFVRKK